MKARAWSPLLAVLLIGSNALAQGEGEEKKETAAKAEDGVTVENGVRKDVKGVKGISPYWEAINKGDAAYVARDYDGAMAAYKEAVQKEPAYAMGHYRMGQAHVVKNELKEAEAAYVAALRYVGEEHALKAKLLFVLADLAERQKNYNDAIKKWDDYEKFATEKPEAKAYAATAAERKKRIEAWKKLVEQYDVVKKRIAKRLAEANEKARRNRR